MIKSKIDDVKDKFENLFYKNLSDYKIAKELNISPNAVLAYRKKHGYVRKSLKENNEIALTQDNKEVLLGTLLGDASLYKYKNYKNPVFSFEHGIKQKEYGEYKAKLLSNLKLHTNIYTRNVIDKRTNKYYTSYSVRAAANPAFEYYYCAFYKNNKKVIPFELLNDFSEKSLAILFMDDGSKTKSGYEISTNCFTVEEVNKFRNFLFCKFGIETSILKTHAIYIRKQSKELFKSLIKKYVIPSMMYKL